MHGGGITIEHLAALEDVRSRASPTVADKQVGCHIVAIGPDAELGVVVHLGVAGLELVAMVSSSGVARLRDSNTLVEGTVGKVGQGELANQPAVSHLIIKNNGIAIIGVFAGAAKTGKQRVVVGGAVEQIARFVINSEGEVDYLHIVIGADRTRGVGGQHAVDVVDALEVLNCGGHGRGAVDLL